MLPERWKSKKWKGTAKPISEMEVKVEITTTAKE